MSLLYLQVLGIRIMLECIATDRNLTQSQNKECVYLVGICALVLRDFKHAPEANKDVMGESSDVIDCPVGRYFTVAGEHHF